MSQTFLEGVARRLKIEVASADRYKATSDPIRTRITESLEQFCDGVTLEIHSRKIEVTEEFKNLLQSVYDLISELKGSL